jgi:hypothetical protein
MIKMLLCACIAVTAAPFALAETITVPAGTRIFGELEQEVTSNIEQFATDDPVMGHVWQDVVVAERTVIRAGTPLVLRISDIAKRKVFGRGGEVEVRAVSVTAVDGTVVFLDGGYDREAENRIILTASLFALVAWPTAFIKGKEAILPPGTVFDAALLADMVVTVPDDAPRIIPPTTTPNLRVEILYATMEEKAKDLPFRMTLCERGSPGAFEIALVNDSPIEEPVEIETAATALVDGCHVTTGNADLKELGAHLAKGINRLTVSGTGESAEVLLDIEM